MKSRRFYFLGLFVLSILLCSSVSAEISLTIISNEDSIPNDIISGLNRYLGNFSYNYYSDNSEDVKVLLDGLDLNYRPIVIYDKDKLEDSELKSLKEKRLVDKSGDYLLFSYYRLRSVTSLEVIDRELKPNELGIFCMSLCPYGGRAVLNIVRFIDRYNLPIKLKFYFIADYENGYLDSMHGDDEIEENVHQLLIEKYWPDKLYDYFLLTEKMSRFQALGELGIPYKKIDNLREEGQRLLIENIKTAKELNVHASPTFIWENKYLISGLDKILFMLDKFKDDYYQSKGFKSDREVVMDFFSSPSCGFCKTVKDEIVPEIYSDYPGLVKVIKFDTSEPEKYKFMLKMEEYYDIDKPGVPKIFIGDRSLVGRLMIENSIYDVIEDNLKNRRSIFPDPKQLIELEYFYSSSNIKRDKDALDIYENFIPQIEERYQGKIRLKNYNITEKDNFQYILNKTKEIKGKQNFYTPTIILDDRIIQTPDNIYKDLDFLIQDKLVSDILGDKKDILLSNVEKFSLPAIISAGLLDGINPCAFTVIIFFISFLTMAGYKKREMVSVGAAFIFSVFLAYILIGVGLFAAFYRLSIYRALADGMRYVIIAAVFMLALLNIYDYLVYKFKGSSGVILKLPHKIKFLIQKTIGRGYRKDSLNSENKSIFKLVLVALGAGFIISVLESVCTGQVYFPTVAFIANLPGVVKLKALGYLIVYNLMFIIPLIVIFLLSLWGVTSTEFSGFLNRNLGKIKLLTAALFILLGVLLLYIY